MTTQNGFSLLEVMLANTLGVFLLAGLVTIYLASKHLLPLQKGFSEIGESGRFSTYILFKRVHQADCVRGISGNAALLAEKTLKHSDILIIDKKKAQKHISTAFFVADTYRKTSTGQPLYALYSKKMLPHSKRQELAPHVVGMKLRFGRVFKQKPVSNWQHTRIVYITLQLVSGIMRRTWHISIGLPNKKASCSL